MIWRLLKRVPKYALVLVLIVGSTVAFYAWWTVHSWKKAIFEGHPVPAEDIGPKLAQIEARRGRLLLVDNDLYDLESGAVIFERWLKEGMPRKLFYDGGTRTFLAEYEHGFARYDLRGAVETTMFQPTKPAFSDDYQRLVYSRDGDIWRAEVDWKDWKLANARKVTAIGQFNDRFFAENIFVGTDKRLILRNSNKVLNVNLDTGAVKPMDFSLLEISKRKSPDGKHVVGLENGKFYCYEVDADAAKFHPVGRGAINDYQWLGNDRCVAIAAGKAVIIYDRLKNTLTELAALPFQCSKIGEPSPDGRFVFCIGRGTGVMVDTIKKTVVPVKGGEGVCWITDDTFAFSREVSDSDLRGSWLQKAGEDERRVSTEPYLATRAGPMLMVRKAAGVVIFATKRGLSTMKLDGTEVAELVKLPAPPTLALGIEEWESPR